MTQQCPICEHACRIAPGATGLCRMYENRDSKLVERFPDQFLMMVPAEIEAMPMVHFKPRGKFLQVCTIGCNFHCPGCVSWVLTANPDAIKAASRKVSVDQIITHALEEHCLGIMFCFNEPAVSFPTFKRLAAKAHSNGLLVGCATNAYFSKEAFSELLDNIDFINIGIKGCGDDTYHKMGATSVAPIYRNLAMAQERVVAGTLALEVAGVYVKGREKEVQETARRIAEISPAIPFQMMRFMPFAGADAADEPSVAEAEQLCAGLKQSLDHIYLFNSPGTTYLDTFCTECGRPLVKRGFNGPMCVHVAEINVDAAGCCVCGARAPGWLAESLSIQKNDVQVVGFFGGYKTINSLEGIQNTLAFLGEKDPKVLCSVLYQVLASDSLKDLYRQTRSVDGYFATLREYARLCGREKEAEELCTYIREKVDYIAEKVQGASRPGVYCALSHPLIAVFADKMECSLVEIAGGRCLNGEIERNGNPGMVVSMQALRDINPDVFISSGAMGYPFSELQEFCAENFAEMSAVRAGRVHCLRPYAAGGHPDWVLGLIYIATLLHPEIFTFDMPKISADFYSRFGGLTQDIL